MDRRKWPWRQTVTPWEAIAGMLLASGSLVCSGTSHGAEAVGWRHQGQGHFTTPAPSQWSQEQGIRWKKPLPATSLASPIVVNDRALIMAEPNRLLCFRVSDGEQLWEQTHEYSSIFSPDKVKELEVKHAEAAKLQEQIKAVQKDLKAAQDANAASAEASALQQQLEKLQTQYNELTVIPPFAGGSTGNTASTPVSDGKDVYVVLGNGMVSSHTLDGQRKWLRFIEKPMDRHSASPVLVGDQLIVHLQHLMALDRETGEVIWKAATPPRNGTPVASKVGDTPVIVTPGGAVVRATDGQILAEKLFQLSYCSPIVHDGVVYAVERGRLLAVKLEPAGDSLKSSVLWEVRGAQDDRLASPILHDGHLYAVTGSGILDRIDAATGKLVQRKRLDLGKGRVDPSLSLVDGLIYVHSNNGTTVVLKPGAEADPVARNELEGFSSTPFFTVGKLLVRTPKHLICIEESSPSPAPALSSTPRASP